MAQDPRGQSAAPENAGSDIVVTGFRASLSSALNLKRNETAAVDVIKAEDIADFPDNNLAESIQRIPGVTITRDAGEGRNITVRGLGPEFTRIRINGMEALSTTGGEDSSGGVNRGRGFDFNTFASELFNSITVRKTPSAEVEEGSLGATVDLQTSRPFDYKGFTFALSGQYGVNDLTKNWDPRIAALISDTFLDGKLGALLSVAYSRRRNGNEGHRSVRWQNGAMTCPGCTREQQAQVNAAFTPRIPSYGTVDYELERLGITGSIQFAPTDRTLISLDVLKAKLDGSRDENFIESPDFSNAGATGRAGIDVLDYEIDDTNSMVYGLFNDVDVRSESRLDKYSTDFLELTLNARQEIGEKFVLRGMLGTSRSNYDLPVSTQLILDRLDTDGFSYDYRGNRNLPVITYPFNVSDPTAYTLTQIRIRPASTDNKFKVAQADLEFKPSDALKIKLGAAYKKYTFDTRDLRRSNGTTANQEGVIPGFAAATPVANYSGVVDLRDQWRIPDGNTLSFLTPDIRVATEVLRLDDRSAFPIGPEASLGSNRTVQEEDTGAYLQGNWSLTLGDMGFRGDIGVRYVKTKQSSFGFQLASGTPIGVNANRSYDDWLPSINMVLEPTSKLLVRASAAKVMARPGLGSLTPGGSVSVAGNNRTVSSGNPNLDPTRANTFDLSAEWYFSRTGLLSGAFFYKDIKSFVATRQTTRPFTGNDLGLPDSVAIAACGTIAGCNPGADWQFSQPVNTDGGTLKGFEINYQQPLTFLPGILRNLGVLANYTYVDSQIKYASTTASSGFVTENLTLLSKNAYNATIYYEDTLLSARVSAAYRDGFLSAVPGANGNTVEGTNSTFSLDTSISVNLRENLSLTFEGLNLTDTVTNQYVDAADRVVTYQHFGRQFYFGFRYRY
jgi:TonB-dependent receptor